MINKNIADKIASQALNEIQFARTYKQAKISNWQKNESMYYGVKQKTTDSRSNVSLGRMQEFVHTLLSKIDTPLVFRFVKRKESQVKRVELLNALRTIDANNDNWDLKDLVGKKQAIIYGRAIFAYHADSVDGKYKSHLENVDVYDFLIDPACGGIDLELASYMGRYGITKLAKELKDGAKKKFYHKGQVETLVGGSGNADENSQEETNKLTRSYSISSTAQKENSKDKYKFWEWVTTFEGERYYILMNQSGHWVRCEKLEDMFSDNRFPFWSYAAFPDLTEFWTPSFCDYSRELFMVQDKNINQMLDNSEAVNKPPKVVDVGAFESLSDLKYRRDGIIRTKKGTDVTKAIQFIKTPSIDTPLKVFEVIESIQEKASGVTAGSKGVSDENGKVGIYEGNQIAAADRFNLLNKTLTFGYKQFANLWQTGVKDHLLKKVAVDIVGTSGIEVVAVNKRDLFKKNDDYQVLVEASDSENIITMQDKKLKLTFLQANVGNPDMSTKKNFEMQAHIVGFNEDEVKELLDKSVYGSTQLLSEAERDIERILDGELIKPNKIANNAYKQRLVDYLKDHEEDMNPEQFVLFADYIESLEPIVMQNEARAFTTEMTKMMDSNPNLGSQPDLPIEEPQDLNTNPQNPDQNLINNNVNPYANV